MKIVIEVDGDELAEFAAIPKTLQDIFWRLDILKHYAEKHTAILEAPVAARQEQDATDMGRAAP